MIYWSNLTAVSFEGANSSEGLDALEGTGSELYVQGSKEVLVAEQVRS